MGYVTGYGSASVRGTLNDTDEIVVPAGTKCVIDRILFDGATLSNDLDVTVQTAAGVTKHSFGIVNGTDPGNVREGLGFGPYGMKMSDGIRILTTDAGAAAGFLYTVLYRDGFA